MFSSKSEDQTLSSKGFYSGFQMHPTFLIKLLTLHFIFSFGGCPFIHAIKIMNVGEELWRETLPLQMGSRIYKLHGLKPITSYEVKISYPASIPASFSIQLIREKPNMGRKLLNTEKLIFKTDNLDLHDPQGGINVLVTVEPEGVVAFPHASEREFIIFNIVCDELLLGISHEAWWVAILVLLCLVLAFIIPSFLPSYLLQNQDHRDSKKF